MSFTLDSFTYPNIDIGQNREQKTNVPENITGNSAFVGNIPLYFIIIIAIIVVYFVLFSSLDSTTRTTTTTSDSTSTSPLGLFLIGIFIFLILLNGLEYIFNINVTAKLKHLFSSTPVLDIKVKETSSGSGSGKGKGKDILRKKEVFHISDNKYNYEDAKAICSAYDGRIANYNELNAAYNEGADWCGYGWSDNQMALFPTQQEKWDKLQKIDGHHHDCGRPGINGGFIDNPNIKFGVNCYGYKPKIKSEEAKNMSYQQLYPKTEKELMFEERIEYWKHKLPDIMVSPFNSDNWSIV
jgi:hypothetical protein